LQGCCLLGNLWPLREVAALGWWAGVVCAVGAPEAMAVCPLETTFSTRTQWSRTSGYIGHVRCTGGRYVMATRAHAPP
jgi:hypothetical protein